LNEFPRRTASILAGTAIFAAGIGTGAATSDTVKDSVTNYTDADLHAYSQINSGKQFSLPLEFKGANRLKGQITQFEDNMRIVVSTDNDGRLPAGVATVALEQPLPQGGLRTVAAGEKLETLDGPEVLGVAIPSSELDPDAPLRAVIISDTGKTLTQSPIFHAGPGLVDLVPRGQEIDVRQLANDLPGEGLN